MIPYTTCMRFNREKTVRRSDDDQDHGKKSTKTSNNPANLFGREWNLLVPCSSSDQVCNELSILLILPCLSTFQFMLFCMMLLYIE